MSCNFNYDASNELFYFLQRHCLHFALTTKPTRQWIPRYEFQRRLRKSLLPIIKSYKAKVLIFVALLVNVIVLALQVSNLRGINMLGFYFIINDKKYRVCNFCGTLIIMNFPGYKLYEDIHLFIKKIFPK